MGFAGLLDCGAGNCEIRELWNLGIGDIVIGD